MLAKIVVLSLDAFAVEFASCHSPLRALRDPPEEALRRHHPRVDGAEHRRIRDEGPEPFHQIQRWRIYELWVLTRLLPVQERVAANGIATKRGRRVAPLTLNDGILRLFTSRIGTPLLVSHPHRSPFTRYTLVQGVSCGNAILRPSGDGTAHNTDEDLSNSHECAPPAST